MRIVPSSENLNGVAIQLSDRPNIFYFFLKITVLTFHQKITVQTYMERA